MDKHHHEHHDNGFFTGFLFGAIIGAAVIFFLFTDKGKKLLKTFLDEGFEGLGDLKDLIQEEMDDEESEDEDYEETGQHCLAKAEHSKEYEQEDERQHSSPNKVKRFFRGVKR